MAELYTPATLQLVAPQTPSIDFDVSVFEKAVKQLFERGGFEPELMSDPQVKALIDETYNVLNGAVASSITQELPEQLTNALRNNAFIFSGYKTYQELREAGAEMTNEDGSVKPFGKFYEDVRGINESYNKRYLYAEYNQAVAASQMAVRWHDWQRDGDDYYLQYRTAGDERVREAHILLDGVTLPPSDPFWREYLPPNGWNCRCTAVQVLKSDYKESDSQKAIEWGNDATALPSQRIFRYNPGTTLNLFPPKHPYYPKREDVAAKEVAKQLAIQYLRKVQREALQEFKIARTKPIEIQGEQYNTGRIYYGSKDRKNVINHCRNSDDVIVAKSLGTAISDMRFIRKEALKQKGNTPKKIARGVKHYTVYEFEADVIREGQQVTVTFELKCEARPHRGELVEFPYVIRQKE